MHYRSIFFYNSESDLENLIEQFDCQTENPEYLKFSMEMAKAQIKKEFKALSKADKKKYGSMDGFASSYYGYSKKDKNGDYGYMTNPNGCYDWYQIGGRYAGMLFEKGINKNDKKFKKLKDKHLVPPNEWGGEMVGYMKLLHMAPFDYCVCNGLIGKNIMPLKKVDWTAMVEVMQIWHDHEDMEMEEKTAGELFYNYFDEDDGYMEADVETFNGLLEKWNKVENAMVVVIDYHC